MQSLSQLCHCSVKAAIEIHKQMSTALCHPDLAYWLYIATPWAKSYLTTSSLRERKWVILIFMALGLSCT